MGLPIVEFDVGRIGVLSVTKFDVQDFPVGQVGMIDRKEVGLGTQEVGGCNYYFVGIFIEIGSPPGEAGIGDDLVF